MKYLVLAYITVDADSQNDADNLAEELVDHILDANNDEDVQQFGQVMGVSLDDAVRDDEA